MSICCMSAATGTAVADGNVGGGPFAVAAPGTSLEAAGADVAGGGLPTTDADGDVPHAAAPDRVSQASAKATNTRIALCNGMP